MLPQKEAFQKHMNKVSRTGLEVSALTTLWQAIRELMGLNVTSTFIQNSAQWSVLRMYDRRGLVPRLAKTQAIRAWGRINITHQLIVRRFVIIACSCGFGESPERWGKLSSCFRSVMRYMYFAVWKNIWNFKTKFFTVHLCLPLTPDQPCPKYLQYCLGQRESMENCPLPPWT